METGNSLVKSKNVLKQVSTPDAPPALGPYSQAIIGGNFVFISGQLPLRNGTLLIDEPIEEQTKTVLENIVNILNAAGSNTSKVVKTTIFLKDMDYFEKVNTVYSNYFTTNPPARSCVAVKDLPKGSLIEMEAIAIIE
jgi:2-iminobutanoate/2-iminopropanoate deaminase